MMTPFTLRDNYQTWQYKMNILIMKVPFFKINSEKSIFVVIVLYLFCVKIFFILETTIKQQYVRCILKGAVSSRSTGHGIGMLVLD